MRKMLSGQPPEPLIASLALLPLTDLASRPEEDYFADGVTWELQKQLEGVDSLRVTALWSVLPYKKSKKSTAQIARELKVSNLVSGSVMYNGDRVRLNMKLMDARTGQPLWAQSYDTTLADLLQTEIKVAHAIGRALDNDLVLAGCIRQPPEHLTMGSHGYDHLGTREECHPRLDLSAYHLAPGRRLCSLGSGDFLGRGSASGRDQSETDRW